MIWLFNRDPHNGLLESLHDWVSPSNTLNNMGPFFHCSNDQTSGSPNSKEPFFESFFRDPIVLKAVDLTDLPGPRKCHSYGTSSKQFLLKEVSSFSSLDSNFIIPKFAQKRPPIKKSPWTFSPQKCKVFLSPSPKKQENRAIYSQGWGEYPPLNLT